MNKFKELRLLEEEMVMLILKGLETSDEFNRLADRQIELLEDTD